MGTIKKPKKSKGGVAPDKHKSHRPQAQAQPPKQSGLNPKWAAGALRRMAAESQDPQEQAKLLQGAQQLDSLAANQEAQPGQLPLPPSIQPSPESSAISSPVVQNAQTGQENLDYPQNASMPS